MRHDLLRLEGDERDSLRPWLLPDRPGPLAGLHVLQSGHGECWVDRWPEPGVALFFAGGNLAFAGSAEALNAGALRARVDHWLETWDRVLIEAPSPFETLVVAAVEPLHRWGRVIYSLEGAPAPATAAPGAELRRLGPGDAGAVGGLDEDLHWIWDTWRDAAGLVASGRAWGAFRGVRLASLAAPFFVGVGYEDIGVVTEPAHREIGLSTLCAGRVCADIRARGGRPSWSTSHDNTGSRRVAEKLGFELVREDFLLVAGDPIGE